MAGVQKTPTASFSPYYGCAIMIAAVMVFGGIIGWGIYSYFAQDKVIASITVEQPVKLPPAGLPAEAQTALEKRLTDFAAAITANQPAELKLSLAELNALLAMAPDTGAGTYADKLHFFKTDPAKNALTAQASLPMNRKFWETGMRYLNGEVTFVLYVHDAGPDAKVVDVAVPGKTVEPGIINNMGIWPWVAPYHTGQLGALLKGVQSAKVTPEGVTFSTSKP